MASPFTAFTKLKPYSKFTLTNYLLARSHDHQHNTKKKNYNKSKSIAKM